MTDISDTQTEGLKAILYGNWHKVNKRTMGRLKQLKLTDGYELTVAGCDALHLPKVEVPPRVTEAREVQDQILALVDRLGWSDALAVSTEMPSGILVYHLRRMVYPDYLSELRGVLFTLRNRVNGEDR